MNAPPDDYFRKLFENSPDGMIVVDDHGRCTDANDALCALLGVKATRILGLHYREIVAAPERGAADSAFESLLVQGNVRVDVPLLREGGGYVDLEWHGKADVAPGRHVGVARDVTRERRLERLVLARAEIARALFEHEDLDEALSTILEQLCIAVRGSFAAFWRPRSDGRRLKMARAHVSRGDDLTMLEQASARIELGPAEGLPGTAWAAGGPVIVADVGHSALIPRAGVLLAAGMRTGVGIPVVVDTPLGVLEAFTNREMVLGDREKEILTSVATLIADHERRRLARRRREAESRDRADVLHAQASAALALLRPSSDATHWEAASRSVEELRRGLG